MNERIEHTEHPDGVMCDCDVCLAKFDEREAAEKPARDAQDAAERKAHMQAVEKAEADGATPDNLTPEGGRDAALEKPEDLPQTIGSLAIVYACPKCKRQCALSEPRGVAAFVAGQAIGLRCPSCNEPMMIGHKRDMGPRIIKPGDPVNRHERRALAAVGRIGR